MLYKTETEPDFHMAQEISGAYAVHSNENKNGSSTAISMTVMCPVSHTEAARIRMYLASLESKDNEHLTIILSNRENGEFVQAYVENLKDEKRYQVEYSHYVNEKQVIHVKRHLTLEEAAEAMIQATSVLPEEFDFTFWLDSGWHKQKTEGMNYFSDHFFPMLPSPFHETPKPLHIIVGEKAAVEK